MRVPRDDSLQSLQIKQRAAADTPMFSCIRRERLTQVAQPQVRRVVYHRDKYVDTWGLSLSGQRLGKCALKL